MKDRQALVLLFFIVILLFSVFFRPNHPSDNSDRFTWLPSQESHDNFDQTVLVKNRQASSTTPDIDPGMAYLIGIPFAINKADAEDLSLLPGIGPELAQKIILYRIENGLFSDHKSLENISGIGANTSQKLAPLLTFQP